MILFFNNKITNVRRPGSPLPHRPNLKTDDRFDIARYSFASYKVLDPLVSKYVFYLSMEDDYASRQDEMESWLRSIFPAEKLSLHWHRCNNINEWREANKEFETIDDPLIYPIGNDDHIFMDSNIDTFTKGIDLVVNDPDDAAVLFVSHYSENMRYAGKFNGELSECCNYVSYTLANSDAIRVMKRDFFRKYLSDINDDRLVFRMESWHPDFQYINKMYCPTKEQFKHYDGYAHVNIDVSVDPPLEIPPGFFEGKIKIRYGFTDIDPSAVNINPTLSYKTVNIVNGVDYKFTLDDLPLFWKPYIDAIEIAPNIDHKIMRKARNSHLTDLMNVSLNSYIGTFNNNNIAPQHWINKHLMLDDQS
jgi:hypothetical protein